jgi:mannose-1-phosphate guanylyltransferase
VTTLSRAVVMAGGRGDRLASMGADVPKALLPVGDGLRLIDLVFDQLRTAGIDRVTLALCHRADEVTAAVHDGTHGFDLDIVVEPEPLGTAGALALVAPASTCLVVNCDVITDLALTDLAATHRAARNDLTIAAHRSRSRSEFGVLEVDDPDAARARLTAWVEKPEQVQLRNMGIYVLEPAVAALLDGGPTGMDVLVQRSLDAGLRAGVHAWDGAWLDAGSHDGIARIDGRELPCASS